MRIVIICITKGGMRIKSKYKIYFLSLICILLALVFSLSLYLYKKNNSKSLEVSKQGFLLDTVIDIKIFDSENKDLLDEAFSLCSFYENLLSKTIEDSDIHRLNNSGTDGYKVHNETLNVIKKGLYYSEISKGAFDITIEPIGALWNFKDSKKEIPNKKEIEKNLKQVNYKDIEIIENTVRFRKENMSIDLGAIAKGYIADRLKDYLESKGVKSGIINLGGNILCIGSHKNGNKFKIGVQKPFEARGESIGALSISDKSIVSSGIYERYFEKDGKIYHHILNPFNGYPYDNNVSQVTIVSDKSVDGDGLSTVCLALGEKKGIDLINSLDGVDGIFITKKGEVIFSNNFKGNTEFLLGE